MPNLTQQAISNLDEIRANLQKYTDMLDETLLLHIKDPKSRDPNDDLSIDNIGDLISADLYLTKALAIIKKVWGPRGKSSDGEKER
ncbi:MAG: hypothetical protein [Caudoviricetes sp.]|nr:MAG: hypothetical protein [Caudoviricetes sp.]